MMCIPGSHRGAISRRGKCHAPAGLPAVRLGTHTDRTAARERLRAVVPSSQAGGAAGTASRALRLEDHGHGRTAGCRMGSLRPGGRLMVAAGCGRVPGGHVHPGGVLGPRRRAPADFQLPAGQLHSWRPVRQSRHRAELRLVDRQAQPPSRPPQHRRRGPRHHDEGDRLHRQPGTRQPGPAPAGVPLPGLPVLPAAARRSGQPSRREHPPWPAAIPGASPRRRPYSPSTWPATSPPSSWCCRR
jgi:hypothetical protein